MPPSQIDKRRAAAVAKVAALWTVHQAASFPDGLRRLEAPSGESVPALDAYLAGCISAYLAGQGTLDSQRLGILATCATDLRTLLDSLTGEDAVYVSRLIEAADLITEPPTRQFGP
nr:hypothetical protein GCM10010200_100010 [Actinomadura rugatobispora]